MLVLALAAQNLVLVPAYAAFVEPDPEGITMTETGAMGWDDLKDALVWYGEAVQDGTVPLKVLFQGGGRRRVTLRLGSVERTVEGDGTSFDFGSFPVKKGAVRAALTTTTTPGPNVLSLLASRDPVQWAQNRRRNAASVHLRWPVPEGADVRWFYNEATMQTDPIWSYTMACGFARGYSGMQVNSPNERRIIFSVWDAGNEAVDRNKVSDENRVELVAKGENVVADSFGNEGTGGHSHLVEPWKTGKPIRFLVGCRPEGEKTLYAGYFMKPGDKAWRLVAAFRAPKDGKALRSLYSFSENFGGANGQLWRESAYGHGWLGLADGTWQPITRATFTTDGHGRTKARWDYDAFVKDGLFHLRHGGFVSGKAAYNDAFEAKPGRKPETPLPVLPQ